MHYFAQLAKFVSKWVMLHGRVELPKRELGRIQMDANGVELAIVERTTSENWWSHHVSSGQFLTIVVANVIYSIIIIIFPDH